MITDGTSYNLKSVKGVGTIFSMWDELETEPGKTFNSPTNKGREHVFVTLQYKYNFE